MQTSALMYGIIRSMKRSARSAVSAALGEIKSLDASDEFKPRVYKANIFSLGEFGIPQIPAIGRTGSLRVRESSPWHVHRGCIEFVCCTAGACVYESEGRRFNLTSGMMFVSRPHEAHRQLECPKGYATFYMLFRPSANKTIRWFADRFARLPRLFACSRSVQALFVRIIALAESGDCSFGAHIRMQTLVQALWLGILDSVSLSIRQKTSKAFSEIAERMQNNPERDYPLEELAAEAGVSNVSFISLFKMANGLTPHAYLLHCRIEEAKRLLKKGLSVKSAADRLGFPTAQHFSRTFRNFVGATPRKWLFGKSV